MASDVLVDPVRLAKLLESVRREACRNPSVLRRLIAVMLCHLCPETGVVQLTREDMAERVRTSLGEVSHALTVLERLGAVVRERSPVFGRRGSGVVLVFVDPALAWSGSIEARVRWLADPRIGGRRERLGRA